MFEKTAKMRTRRILITVEYKGTNYFGWQKNGELRTISGELESAFNRLIGRDIAIYGSGRTDAGVHAVEQAAHLDIPFDFMPTKKNPRDCKRVFARRYQGENGKGCIR